MSRDQLIEELARHICNYKASPCPGLACGECAYKARAALLKIESLGYVVVPRIPTKEMTERGGAEYELWADDSDYKLPSERIYRAMIDSVSPKG